MIDESDEDVERFLAAAIPRQAPIDLRAVVLATVAAELDERRPSSQAGWQSWVSRAVAAMLLFSVVAYSGVAWLESRRMAAWDTRRVVRSDVAEATAAVASVTDESSAQAFERYLLSRLHEDISPTSDAMNQDVREIQRWAEGEPLADRSQSHETNEDRI
jgi:hypothetical protein